MLAVSSKDYNPPRYNERKEHWIMEHKLGGNQLIAKEFHFTFEAGYINQVVPEVQVEDRVTLHYCGRSVKPHGRSLRKYGNATLAPLVSWASCGGKRFSKPNPEAQRPEKMVTVLFRLQDGYQNVEIPARFRTMEECVRWVRDKYGFATNSLNEAGIRVDFQKQVGRKPT